MKKVAILTSVAAIALFSGIASAELSPEQIKADMQDGWAIVKGNDVLNVTAGYSDTTTPRNFDPNEAFGDQTAVHNMTMAANLPCYLEFSFTGNDVNKTLKSFGAAGSVTNNDENYIAFFPSLGGFMKGNAEDDDASWTWLENSTHKNANVEPGSYTYIRACDTFAATLWSNMNYKYEVTIKDGGLKGGLDNAAILPVLMRAKTYVGESTTKGISDLPVATADWNVKFKSVPNPAGSTKTIVSGSNYLKTTQVFHQFKVPYNRDFSAGHYTGKITFTAATIN